MANPLEETQRDVARRINRVFGVVDELPCAECETVFPVHKLNLLDLARIGKKAEEHEPEYFLDEVLRPVTRRIFGDQRMAESAEQTFSKAALWAEDPEVRRQAAETLQRYVEHRRGRDERDE